MWSHSRRYPLLLSRVYKNTPESDPNRSSLREAKHRFEELLEHINNASPSLTYHAEHRPSFSRVLLSQKTKLTSSLRGKRKSVLQQLLRRGSDVVSEELEIHNVSCGA